MNRQIRDEWTRRLRSGDYVQGEGLLRDASGRYCCLGVLCEIAVDAGVIPAPVKGDGEFLYGGSGAGASSAYLPNAVATWAGLPDRYGQLSPTASVNSDLASANDHGQTFDQIADLIEEHF